MIPEFQGALGLQRIAYRADMLWCGPELTLQKAAERMQAWNVGSILIGTPKQPLGILTDTDLRKAVARGVDVTQATVEMYMTSGLVTCSPKISGIQALHIMLQDRISHLGIVSEASKNREVIGIVSQRDLLHLQDQSAAGIICGIFESDTVDRLKHYVGLSNLLIADYLKKGIPYQQLAEIRTTLNDALTHRVLELVSNSYTTPPNVSCCWLALGSQGRAEQVFPTDQDNALIFLDVRAESLEETRSTFVEFASRVNEKLAKVGFELCPAGMMAQNPKWCLSVSEWKQRFTTWIHQTDETGLRYSTIFFDYRGIWGSAGLERELTEHIQAHLIPHPVFLNYLGIDAIKSPKPLGIFGRFKKEAQGAHRGSFDLKARLLMPYIDSARLLVLNSGLTDPKNTLDRFNILRRAEPQNANLFSAATEAFEFLAALRARHHGATKSANGRFLTLQHITTAERNRLKQAAKTLIEIQRLVITRFQLSQLL